ncbi:MAG: argininosuccinate lyase [Lachnospiraceae bacterium]|nr:argininosuccinate lyase [Lachnospiraceae bacterium]
MAQLWGGRFTKETDQRVKDFNDSLRFDIRLLQEDILGSMVHAGMLARVGVLTGEEADAIIEGLCQIGEDAENGKLDTSEGFEDVHSLVEANLIRRIGETGKKLHTGRSRNDQVALDMRLYTRRRMTETGQLVVRLLETLLSLMKEHTDTVMPGFTHLQKAQPVTLAHHLGAYFEMFRRDADRLTDGLARMNECPLGAGALAGTTYPLDREYTAEQLGFFGPTANSMDSVSDRDYLLEYLFDLSVIMMHLSRFSEEIILWNSDEYRFIELDDAFSTGSSIMPQKKNPDIAELVRGKTGRVYGELMALLTVMKGLPLAYNKDLQEDKEGAFDAMDTANTCLELFTDMLDTASFRKDVMERSAKRGFTNATDAADYLVRKGVPFRDAHGIIGRMVVECIGRGIGLEEMTLEEMQAFSPDFDRDIYEALSMKVCVDRRATTGAPGKAAMEEEIKHAEEVLAELTDLYDFEDSDDEDSDEEDPEIIF